MKPSKVGRSVMMAVITVWLGACASHPKHSVDTKTNATPSEEIARVDQELLDLKNQNADVLANDAYAKAQDALASAKKEEASKSPSADYVLKKTALAEAWGRDARDQSDRVRDRLQNVLESRKFASQAQAPNLFPNRWKDAETELERTARAGRDKPDQINGRIDEMNRTYIGLEKDAVARTNMKPVKETLDLAKKEGAAKYAPRAYKDAVLQFELSMQAVKGAPRNQSVVQKAARKAQDKADYALEITRRADGQVGAEEFIRENIAAEERAAALTHRSTEAMTERNRALHERNQAEGRAAALEATLADEQANDISTKADRIREKFAPNEADVYVQGSQVLIRLKGLRFASGQSQVTPQQYALLRKAADAIEMFNSRRVTVEGHTDSIGSSAVNRRLSQERADNVRSYLLSVDENLDASEIQATGFGDERPVAINRTADGRAMNRRIDLIIDTQ